MPHAEITYLFRHAVMRDAAYGLQLPTQRGALHRLAAELIEQVAGDLPEAAGEIADHLAVARETGDSPELREREQHWATRAAKLAAAAYELRDAQRHWLRVATIGQGSDVVRAWLEVSAAARLSGDHRQFEQAAERALELARTGSDRGLECEAIEHTANVAFDRGDFITATDLTAQALELARRHGDSEHETGMLANQGLNYLELGRLSDSAKIFEELMPRLSEKPAANPNACINYAMLLDRQGRTPDALDWFHRALELSRHTGQVDIESSALNHIGTIAWREQRLQEADDCFVRALSIAQRIGDPHQQALTYSNQGLLRQDQGRAHESLAMLQQAEAICEEFAIAFLHGTTVSNQAFAYRELGQLDMAEACMVRSADICLRYGDKAGYALAMGNVASIHSGKGELERAKDIFEAVLPIEEEQSLWRFLGNHLCEYSMVLAQLSRLAPARQQWHKGYSLVLKHGSAEEVPRRLERMHKVCAALGIPAFPIPA